MLFPVQVVAEEAARLEDLDSAAAQSLLTKATSDVSSASSEEAKAEAQIAVEVAEALVKATSGGA